MSGISLIKNLYLAYHNFYRKYYGMERDVSSFRYPIEQILKTEKNIKCKESYILEYGCGSGFNIEYLYNIGYTNVFGIEQNLEVYSDISMDQDIVIFKGNFVKGGNNLTNGIKFDFIFTRSVLQQKEGIGIIDGDFNSDDDIIKILIEFSKLLNPDGIIFLNEGSSTRDWYTLISKSGLDIIDDGNNFFKLKIKI
jgi:SAM-dependent methyltransferase